MTLKWNQHQILYRARNIMSKNFKNVFVVCNSTNMFIRVYFGKMVGLAI